MSDSSSKRSKRTLAVLGIYLTEVRDGGYYHVRGSAVWIGATPHEMREIDQGREVGTIPYDRIRNVREMEAAVPGMDLSDLYIGSQGCDEDSPRRLYGWEIHYRDVHSIDRRRAERMARTLKSIEARMERTNAKYGRATTFGGYVLRVADAIGATRIVLREASEKASRGWSYDHSSHRILDLRDGQYAVDQLVRTWATELGREAPAAVNEE